jgi:hypothetical protein
LVLDDFMKDGELELAEIRRALDMPDPHEALRQIALGIEGLQKWHKWHNEVGAPLLREIVELKAELKLRLPS